MALMEWDTSLDVGVADMNHEHQQLLDLMNQLHDAHQKGKSGPDVLRILDALGAATTKHFKDEEAYMERIGYPKLSTHKLIHADLLKKFTAFSGDIHARNGVIGNDFFVFLKLWLTAHIKGIDMQYAPKANQRQAS